MSLYSIKDTTLTAIGDAIREKNGSTDKYTSEQMATAILAITTGGGSGGLTEEGLNVTGNCSYRFGYNGWNWFINAYGNQITCKPTDAKQMFVSSTNLTEIPFEINMSDCTNVWQMFNGCNKLKKFPKIVTDEGKLAKLSKLTELYNNCYRLNGTVNFDWVDWDYMHTNKSAEMNSMFTCCYSLRSIPEDQLKKIYCGELSSYKYSSTHTYYMFNNCYALDEIRGVFPALYNGTSNCYSGTFSNCYRAKEIIFATQEDGTPYVRSTYKNQTIDLSNVGRAQYAFYIYDYNAGIDSSNLVTDDASYQALKDTEDWFTTDWNYSRYNHDSAVNTINSLPDVSASGGTNTIKFKGAAGALTDAGAINTLTEEEIAVATAKGWAVTFV
jgi:hypothetical protein